MLEIEKRYKHKVEIATCRICYREYYRMKKSRSNSRYGVPTQFRVRHFRTKTCSRDCSRAYVNLPEKKQKEVLEKFAQYEKQLNKRLSKRNI